MRQVIHVWLSTMLVFAASGCAGDSRSPEDVIRDGMEATRLAIDEVVEDDARRSRLLELADELDVLLSEQNRDLNEASRRLAALNADPEADRASFEAVVGEVTASRRARRSRSLDLHFEMIELTTPAEWKHIIKREMEALGAVLGREEG